MNGDVILQNINYLRYPLWFQHLKHDGDGYVWNNEVYEVRTGYKAPDYRDAAMLYYLLKCSQEAGWKKSIEFVRSEMLRSCGLPTNHTTYYARIEDSLKRWKSLSIFFKGKFYRDGKHHEIGFGIVESYDIKGEGRKKTMQVEFNSVWLDTIKDIAAYYNRVCLPIYSVMSSPGARRLYEILLCDFSRQPYFCGVKKLGEQLTLSQREDTGRKDSYVLRQVERAVKEINRVMKDKDIRESSEPKDVFTVTYQVKEEEKGKKTITFIRHFMDSPEEKEEQGEVDMVIVDDFIDMVDQDWDVDFSRRKVVPPDDAEKRAYYKSFCNVVKDPIGVPIGVPRLCVWTQDYRVRMSLSPG